MWGDWVKYARSVAHAGSQGMTIRRVFIADDERDIRHLLRTVLEEEGYEVETRADGKEAIEFLAAAREPWIVLLDVMMPHFTGLDVCRWLEWAEAEVGGERHRVMLMTASDLLESNCPPSVRTLVRKPFELEDVVKLVAALTHDRTL
jgi:CheY-like chemotaxis protein